MGYCLSSFALLNSKWESDELVIATLISLGSVFICFCFAGIHFKWKPFPHSAHCIVFISTRALMLDTHRNLKTPVSVSLLFGRCCEMVLWYCSDEVTRVSKTMGMSRVFTHRWNEICLSWRELWCSSLNYLETI